VRRRAEHELAQVVVDEPVVGDPAGLAALDRATLALALVTVASEREARNIRGCVSRGQEIAWATGRAPGRR